MKKQKAHVNHIPRANHAGGYIERHRMENGNWVVRESVNYPTDELFDAKIKAISKGLREDDGLKEAAIVIFNSNHSVAQLRVTMGEKKAYDIFNA